MSNQFDDPISRNTARALSIDEGLRSHMMSVYNYMAMGLGLTGLVAYLISTQPAVMNAIFGTPLFYVALFAPLALVFLISAKLSKFNFATIQTLFWVYAALMGVSLSSIFIVYQMPSITRVFLITAGTFGSMSLYGYTTKRDLTAMGSFLFMGVIGLIIASVVNMFMQSNMMQMVLSAITVLVFTGLTAYDTQMIKELYSTAHTKEAQGKMAVMGALSLYIDFINIFLSLLRLFGDRR